MCSYPLVLFVLILQNLGNSRALSLTRSWEPQCACERRRHFSVRRAARVAESTSYTTGAMWDGSARCLGGLAWETSQLAVSYCVGILSEPFVPAAAGLLLRRYPTPANELSSSKNLALRFLFSPEHTRGPSQHVPPFRHPGRSSKGCVTHAGPVPISFSRTVSGAELYFQKALEAHGVKTMEDGARLLCYRWSARLTVGVYLPGSVARTLGAAATIDPRTGNRSTAATASLRYIVLVLDTRPNLKVLTATYVNRIPTKKEGDDVIATDVEYFRACTLSILPKKCSVRESQHILELSGVGNRNVLELLLSACILQASHLHNSAEHPVLSADPKVQSTIEPNYLAEEVDMEILVESAEFIGRVTQNGPWKDVSEEELIPVANVTTDEQLGGNFVDTVAIIDASSTCSLAPKEKGGVVDVPLKVYGTKNIRVADLSILPLLTVVRTQGKRHSDGPGCLATTYGIAEQGGLLTGRVAAEISKAGHGI
ncbi:GMC oxidoreductase-domain-containing protein [Dichomitus squalens]|nr:GMC oxidoreductase-domain-containing protein [Dichomitus squalens]